MKQIIYENKINIMTLKVSGTYLKPTELSMMKVFCGNI